MKLARLIRILNLVIWSLVIGSLPSSAWAKLKVVTSTTDVAGLVRAIGADDIQLESIARGTQDPHYIEAKPSYMTKLAHADLLVANGLGLEVGWLPSLIRGARNPKLNPGQKGYLELGESVAPLDIPQGTITRAMGDIHPEGNPHFTLDPERMAELAKVVAKRLGELDTSAAPRFSERAESFAKSTAQRMKDWKARVDRLPNKKVVTYHNSLLYFTTRFGLQPVGVLEPKPGIPPSAQHALDIIATMKRENAKAILVDNYFDPKIAHHVERNVPGAKVQVVGIAVESAPGLPTLADVTEGLIQALERVARP
ncbi:MAG: metal ABC transporter substrate-binding protein [Bdellovibrionaceae bacterium]|nr:metal ABC transporter substrate-binding protein [Pseudobdellovibrionaceae bacterium]